MKKIISLLALVGLLLLPVLAGCMDEAPAFLRVSAAEAETDIGETVSVEDARKPQERLLPSYGIRNRL